MQISTTAPAASTFPVNFHFDKPVCFGRRVQGAKFLPTPLAAGLVFRQEKRETRKQTVENALCKRD